MPRGRKPGVATAKAPAKKTAKKAGRAVDPVKKATNAIVDMFKLYFYATRNDQDIEQDGFEFYDNYILPTDSKQKLDCPFSFPSTVKLMLYKMFEDYCGVISTAGENQTIERDLQTLSSDIFNCGTVKGELLQKCEDPRAILDACYLTRVGTINAQLRTEGLEAFKRFLKRVAYNVAGMHYYNCGTMQNMMYFGCLSAGIGAPIVDEYCEFIESQKPAKSQKSKSTSEAEGEVEADAEAEAEAEDADTEDAEGEADAE